jgi:hypothetical protein
MFIETKGFMLCGIEIPQFSLACGTVMIFDWPKNMGGKEEQSFYEILTGGKKIDALILRTKVEVSMPHAPSFLSSSLSELLSLCSTDSLLFQTLARGGFKNTEAKLHDMPLVVRIIMAMAFASAKAKVVVFNTAGLDPLGRQLALEYAKAKARKEWSFVEMNFPKLGDAPTCSVSIHSL